MPSDVDLSFFFLPYVPVGIPSGYSGIRGWVVGVVVDWLGAWINSKNSDTWTMLANLLAPNLADN